MKLRKIPKPGQCHAQRCSTPVNHPETLCAQHRNQEVDAPEQTALVLESGPEVDALSSTRTELLSLLDTASNVPLDAVCESPVGQVTGLALLGQIREYARQNRLDLDKQREEHKRPFLSGCKEVDARYRPALDTAAALMRACDDRIRVHALAQDAERREALAEVSRLAQEKAPVAAIQVAHERAQASAPALPPQVKFKTRFEFKVVDHALIPREFLVLDVSKLQAHINQTQGTRPVDGIEITRVEDVATA